MFVVDQEGSLSPELFSFIHYFILSRLQRFQTVSS